MKKFYAFAAAAVAAVSMNAQLYVCGNGTNMGWAPEAPLTVELTDGAYKFVAEGASEFKISAAMGDWDAFNGAAKTCTVAKEDMGKAIDLTDGDANITLPWSGDWNVTVAGDLSTITLTTDTPEPTGPATFYVRGAVNNWLNDGMDEAWQFKHVDGDLYEIECSLEGGKEFKIADGNWGAISFSFGTEIAATDMNEELVWFKTNDNTTLAEDFSGVIKAEYTNGGEEMYVTFVPGAGVSDVAVDANAPAEYFNLQGVRVANPENGLFIVRQGGKVTKVVK